MWNPAQVEQWQPIEAPSPVVARRYTVDRCVHGELLVEAQIHEDGTITVAHVHVD